MLYITPINYDQHYPIIKSWWEGHKWPVIPEVMLPPVGWIVGDADKLIVAGFLYQAQGAPIGWLEFIVANPTTTGPERTAGIKLLLDTATDLLPALGVKWAFTMTNNPKLAEKLVEGGFTFHEHASVHSKTLL